MDRKKEGRKQPAKTLVEKRAAKRDKKEKRQNSALVPLFQSR